MLLLLLVFLDYFKTCHTCPKFGMHLSSEYGVHPTVIHKWRQVVKEGIPTLLSR